MRAVVVSFLTENEVEIPGVTTADVLHTLRDALDKSAYVDYGIPPERVNDVFTVVKPLSAITTFCV